MTILSRVASDRSTYIITISFFDEEEDTMVPDTLEWYLTDEVGTIVNGRSAEEVTPAEEVTVVLKGDDLAASAGTKRVFTIKGTYTSTLGAELPFTAACRFNVAEWVGILDPIAEA